MVSQSNNLLSADLLISKGFKLIEESPFENYKMPYYVKDSVILFFNTPVNEYDKNNFLIGYGELNFGLYSAVTFKWIKTYNDLKKIYTIITDKILK